MSTYHRYGVSRGQVSARRNELAWLYGPLHPVFAPDADCNDARMEEARKALQLHPVFAPDADCNLSKELEMLLDQALHPVFAPDADCNDGRMQIIEIESSDCTWFLGRMK